MKSWLPLLLSFFSLTSAFCTTKELKTILFSKNEFNQLTAANSLLDKSLEYALGKRGKQNDYYLDVVKVELENENETFEYYPSNSDKKKNFHDAVNQAQKNHLFTFKVYLDKKKSVVNQLIIPNLSDDYSFTLQVAIIGDGRVFVTEAANKSAFLNIIDEKSFTDKAFKKFFGDNPNKSVYNISFDKMNACLVKNIQTNECAERFDGTTYDKFSERVTSADYSGSFILIDLHVIREKSKLTPSIEKAVIKDSDGTEHLRFYFCVPQDNIRKKKKDISLEGKIYSASKKPVTGLTIYLRDATNLVVATQTTDNQGLFRFEKIKDGVGYSLLVDNSCKESSLFLHDKNDVLIGQYQKTAIGFVYKLLEADVARLSPLEETDPSLELHTSIKGKMLSVTDKINPISNQVIELKNSGNQVIQSQKTDNNGNFSFTKVDPQGNYSIELPNYTAVSKTEKVYLANAKNELVKEFKRGANNKFSYKIVPADMQLLSSLDEPDPELTFNKQKAGNNKEIVIHDFIYFNVNSFTISNESKATLDKISKIVNENPGYKVEIISHTDSRGESAENLKLSEKRSAAVMNYFITKNVDGKRLKSTGMGEAKPLNNCGDGSNCVEEEYKMNRRTEFRFYK